MCPSPTDAVVTVPWLSAGMPGLFVAAIVMAACGLGALVGAVSPTLLRSLREPAAEDLAGGPAPGYATLATTRFAAAVGLGVALAATVVGARIPPVLWPVWLGVVTAGVLLAWIDARTTWLPRRIMIVLWATTAGGLLVSALWRTAGEPGTTTGPAGPLPAGVVPALLIPVIAATGAGLLFGLVHLISRGRLGMGDVQLVVPLTAASAAVSTELAMASLLIGTLTAAAFGLVLLVLRRGHEFAYGPFLVAGCLIGAAVLGSGPAG